MMSGPLRLCSIEQAPVGDGLCVYNPKSNALCLLNSSAACYWLARMRGETPEAFAASVNRNSGIDYEQVRRDVEQLEADWHAAGLLAKPIAGGLPDGPIPKSGTPGASLDAVFQADNGGTLRICADEPLLGKLIDEVLRPFRHMGLADGGTDGALEIWLQSGTPDGPDARFAIARDGQVVLSEVDRATARRVALRNLLFSSWAAQQVGAMLHAACVTWRGQAIILAGSSGAGKSTLAAGLVARGWLYGSDDLTPVMRDGLHTGRFPTAMSIKSGAFDAVGADAPGLVEVPSHLVLGRQVKYLDVPQVKVAARLSRARAIVFPQFRAEAARLEQRQLDMSQTLARLIETGSGPDGRPNSIHPLLKLIESVPAFELVHRNCDEANAALQGLLS